MFIDKFKVNGWAILKSPFKRADLACLLCEYFFLQISGSNLDKCDVFSESDPFFTVNKTNPDGTDTLVYRSDYIKVSWNFFCVSKNDNRFRMFVLILPSGQSPNGLGGNELSSEH